MILLKLKRKQMLQILNDEKKTVILTTKSMEEAEALCQRVGILIKGELK